MKLNLAYPITPIHFNQYFGQNANSFYKTQGMPGHNGCDFMAYHGQPVYASTDGTASFQIDPNGVLHKWENTEEDKKALALEHEKEKDKFGYMVLGKVTAVAITIVVILVLTKFAPEVLKYLNL